MTKIFSTIICLICLFYPTQLPMVICRAPEKTFSEEVVKVIEAEVTAYNPVKNQCDDNPLITASGQKVREGIAACPEWLPFGSLVEIQDQVYECQDLMLSLIHISEPTRPLYISYAVF